MNKKVMMVVFFSMLVVALGGVILFFNQGIVDTIVLPKDITKDWENELDFKEEFERNEEYTQYFSQDLRVGFEYPVFTEIEEITSGEEVIKGSNVAKWSTVTVRDGEERIFHVSAAEPYSYGEFHSSAGKKIREVVVDGKKVAVKKISNLDDLQEHDFFIYTIVEFPNVHYLFLSDGENPFYDDILKSVRFLNKTDEKTMRVVLPLFAEHFSEEELNGARGTERYIGCGDVLFYIERNIPHTIAPLKAAYEELFSLPEIISVEGRNYINPIYNHAKGSVIKSEGREDKIIKPLQFEKVVIENKTAHVYLIGDYATVGTCEPPRTKASLESIATQFDTVDNVNIYLNGEEMRLIHGGI